MRWRVHDIIYTRVRDIDARYGTIRAVTRKEKKRLFIDIVVRDTDGRIAQQHRARNKDAGFASFAEVDPVVLVRSRQTWWVGGRT